MRGHASARDAGVGFATSVPGDRAEQSTHDWLAGTWRPVNGLRAQLAPNGNRSPVASSASRLQDMHMRRTFMTDEAKKKLWRPSREAWAQGL
jgi:hypothetical protein